MIAATTLSQQTKGQNDPSSPTAQHASRYSCRPDWRMAAYRRRRPVHSQARQVSTGMPESGRVLRRWTGRECTCSAPSVAQFRLVGVVAMMHAVRYRALASPITALPTSSVRACTLCTFEILSALPFQAHSSVSNCSIAILFFSQYLLQNKHS